MLNCFNPYKYWGPGGGGALYSPPAVVFCPAYKKSEVIPEISWVFLTFFCRCPYAEKCSQNFVYHLSEHFHFGHVQERVKVIGGGEIRAGRYPLHINSDGLLQPAIYISYKIVPGSLCVDQKVSGRMFELPISGYRENHLQSKQKRTANKHLWSASLFALRLCQITGLKWKRYRCQGGGHLV